MSGECHARDPVSGAAPPESDRRELLARLLRERFAAPPAEHPLSYNQRSLWFMHRMAPDSAAYNVPYAFEVSPPVAVGALRRAFEMLIARHAILRTTYSATQPVQVVHPRQDLDFEEVEASGWDDTELWARVAEEAERPFDLCQGPVLRVRLFARDAAAPVLLATFHHIAYDLWSMMTFLNELGALYAAARAGAPAPLPPLQAQYTDFVRWQSEMLASDGERLWAYWREQLSGALPVLQLPADFPRPPVPSYLGATHTRAVPPALAQQLQTLARAEGATLFTLLVTAFQIFLHGEAGQDDILVGTPMAGRSRPEFEQLLGYFLNSVPLRANFSADPDFRAALRASGQVVRGALEHQDFPVELLVERLKPARSADRPPLFQTMFVLNRPHRIDAPPEPSEDGAELRLNRVPLDLQISQFDLSLEIDQLPDVLRARWEYNTDLFCEPTVASWAARFEDLLQAIVADPARRVSTLLSSVPVATTGLLHPDTGRPPTAAEEAVSGIFREVFEVDEVAIHDSFFDLGGDSAGAARLAARLSALAGVQVPVTTIFERPTIEALAGRLEELLLEQLPLDLEG